MGNCCNSDDTGRSTGGSLKKGNGHDIKQLRETLRSQFIEESRNLTEDSKDRNKYGSYQSFDSQSEIWNSTLGTEIRVKEKGISKKSTLRPDFSQLIQFDYKEGNIGPTGNVIKHLDYQGQSYFGEVSQEKMIPEGQGSIQYTTGDVYTGEFTNGRKHGAGIVRFNEGDAMWLVGDFVNDVITGEAIIYTKNNCKIMGPVVNSSINGKGNFIWGNGSIYKGPLKDSLPHGSGKN